MLVLLVLGLFVERTGRADAGYHVFTLGVDQPFAVEIVLAGGRIAAERHAGSRRIAHVTEDHTLHVDGRSPAVRDTLDPAIGDRPFAVPTLEDRTDRAAKLVHGVVGELAPENLFDLGFIRLAERLQIGGGQVGVFGVSLRLLDRVQQLLELLADTPSLCGLDVFGLLHHDVAVHRDQPAIGVVDESLAARLLHQTRDRRRAEPDVQDGFHHAGHRLPGTATAGDQQRVIRIAVLHTHCRFG